MRVCERETYLCCFSRSFEGRGDTDARKPMSINYYSHPPQSVAASAAIAHHTILQTPAPLSLTHTHTHTLTDPFPPCIVIDRQYICHAGRLRHFGVKGVLSLSLASFIPLLLFLSVFAPHLGSVCVTVCVRVCVCEHLPAAAPSLSLKCYLATQLDVGNSR